jgi:hypothetical protein
MPPRCLELGLIDVAGQGARCSVCASTSTEYSYVGTYEYIHRALVTAWHIRVPAAYGRSREAAKPCKMFN